jgi:protein-serine/threonine kinase
MSFVPFNDQHQHQQGQQQQQQQPQQPQLPQSANGYGPNSYFMNNPYPPSVYQQQQQMAFQQTFQAPQPTYQQRQQLYNNDSTNGLVHQFSHQNLGGAARGGFVARQPSPSQRPRTAGAPSGSPSTSFLSAPMPGLSFQQPAAEYEIAPERNADKYTSKELAAARACSESAANFFKESVKRARERNERYVYNANLNLNVDTSTTTLINIFAMPNC